MSESSDDDITTNPRYHEIVAIWEARLQAVLSRIYGTLDCREARLLLRLWHSGEACALGYEEIDPLGPVTAPRFFADAADNARHALVPDHVEDDDERQDWGNGKIFRSGKNAGCAIYYMDKDGCNDDYAFVVTPTGVREILTEIPIYVSFVPV